MIFNYYKIKQSSERRPTTVCKLNQSFSNLSVVSMNWSPARIWGFWIEHPVWVGWHFSGWQLDWSIFQGVWFVDVLPITAIANIYRSKDQSNLPRSTRRQYVEILKKATVLKFLLENTDKPWTLKTNLWNVKCMGKIKIMIQRAWCND